MGGSEADQPAAATARASAYIRLKAGAGKKENSPVLDTERVCAMGGVQKGEGRGGGERRVWIYLSFEV